MISKDVTDKINQLLNNGYSFGKHKTKKQRDEIEQDLLDYYDKNGFGAFLEEEMIYIVDTKHQQIMMLEITKNSIYFNPREHIYLLEAVIVALEFVTTKLSLSEETEEIVINIEDEITEEMPKPKPNFDTL